MVTAIKTAQAWGKPPGFFLTNTEEWTPQDRTLALGYQIYLGLLCPECGNPLAVCRDAATAGWWETQTATCYASKAVAEKTSQPGYKPQAGEIIYPVLDKPKGDATGYGAPPDGWEF